MRYLYKDLLRPMKIVNDMKRRSAGQQMVLRCRGPTTRSLGVKGNLGNAFVLVLTFKNKEFIQERHQKEY